MHPISVLSIDTINFSLPSTRFVYEGAGNHLHHRQGTACLYSSVHDAIGTARAQTLACMGNTAACSRATRSSQEEQGVGRASGRASRNSAAQFRHIHPSSNCLPPQRASERARARAGQRETARESKRERVSKNKIPHLSRLGSLC